MLILLYLVAARSEEAEDLEFLGLKLYLHMDVYESIYVSKYMVSFYETEK